MPRRCRWHSSLRTFRSPSMSSSARRGSSPTAGSSAESRKTTMTTSRLTVLHRWGHRHDHHHHGAGAAGAEGAGITALQPLSDPLHRLCALVREGRHLLVQHHNVLQASKRVNGRVLLANLFFLFWLSLIPFVVRWVGEAGVHPRYGDRIRGHHAALHPLVRDASSQRCSWPIRMTRRSQEATSGRNRARITVLAYLLGYRLACLWPLIASRSMSSSP